MQHEPDYSSFTTLMTEFNAWGQAAMMIQKLQIQSAHCRSQARAATNAGLVMDAAIEKLKKERDDLVKAIKMLKEIDRKAGIKDDIHSSLERELSILKENKIAVAGVALTATAAAHLRPSSSPSIQLPHQQSRATATPKLTEFVSPASLSTQQSAFDPVNVPDMSSEDEEEEDDCSEEEEKEDPKSKKAKDQAVRDGVLGFN